MLGMNELLEVMPEAETNMNNAKEAIEQKIRTIYLFNGIAGRRV